MTHYHAGCHQHAQMVDGRRCATVEQARDHVISLMDVRGATAPTIRELDRAIAGFAAGQTASVALAHRDDVYFVRPCTCDAPPVSVLA